MVRPFLLDAAVIMSKTESKKVGAPSKALVPEGGAGVASGFLAETESYQAPKSLWQNTGKAEVKIGPPDDRFEREANRVADMVTRGSFSGANRGVPGLDGFNASGPVVQMERTEKQLQDDMIRAISPDTPPQPIARLQRHSGAVSSGGADVVQSGEGADVVSSHSFSKEVMRGGGRGASLPASVRGDMERRFGRSFQRVRIHSDIAAHRLSDQVGARAFAYKNDIYFGRNQFRPETKEGRHLLAHELTHAVQQGAAPRIAKGLGAGTAAFSTGPSEAAKGVVQRVSGKKHKLESMGEFVARAEKDIKKRASVKKVMSSKMPSDKANAKKVEAILEELRTGGKGYSDFGSGLVGISRTEERGITAFKSKPAAKRAKRTRTMTRAEEQKFLKKVHLPFQFETPREFNQLLALFEPKGFRPYFTEVENLGTGDLGRGMGMRAYLTPAHFSGSTPDDDPEIWYGLGDLRWTAPTYIQGHLLNENLGGEGKRWNLTPITNEANSLHKTQVEKDVKKWVNDDKKDIYYEVIPDYSGAHNKRKEEEDIDDYFKTPSVKAGVEKRLKHRKRELAIEREKLALGLDCQAYEVEWDYSSKNWKQKSGGEDLGKVNIPNHTGGDLEKSKGVDLGFPITF